MQRLDLSEEQKNNILKEYPFLTVRNVHTDSITEFNFLDYVPSGWLNIVIDFLPKLKARLIEINFLDQYRISHIKEKYGYIRWYDNTDDTVIMHLISDLEHKSEETCIICGQPANWKSLGWISPYCEDCKNHLETKMQNDSMTKHFEKCEHEYV